MQRVAMGIVRRTLNGYKLSYGPGWNESECFGVTRLFRADVTVGYRAARFLGLPTLRTNPKTQEAICVDCSMCERIYPTQCIAIGFSPDADTGERAVVTFPLDAGRCMWCGLCGKSCPVDEITMSNAFEMSTTARERLIYQKAQLAEISAGAREYFAQ